MNKQVFSDLCDDALRNKDTYLQEARSRVTRWEYYEGSSYYHLAPYWFERNIEPKGIPTSNSDGFNYGFDCNNQLIYMKVGYWEECIERSGERIINRTFLDGRVNSIEVIILEEGRPIEYTEFVVRNGIDLWHIWSFKEYYRYSGKQLTTIELEKYEPKNITTYSLEYKETGELKKITKLDDEEIIYLEMSVEEVTSLRSTVIEELYSECEAALQRLGKCIGESKLCFLAIWLHQETQAVVNPTFIAGMDYIREEQLADGEDLETLWYIGYHSDYDEGLENEDLIRKFSLLMNYWELHSNVSDEPTYSTLQHHNWWGEGLAIWQEVAYRLNRRKWDKVLPVTDHFVVFIDEENFDPSNDLPRYITHEQLAKLQAKELI